MAKKKKTRAKRGRRPLKFKSKKRARWKKKKRGQKEGAKGGGIKKRSPYRKKGVTSKKWGLKKKKRGRLEGVTKNALLKKEGKCQKKKKRRARPPILEPNFWRPPFMLG